MKKFMWINGLVAVALVLIDQIFKNYISSNLPLGHVREVIPGLISITNLRNDGAAWSILEGNQSLFLIITLVALGVLGYILFLKRDSWSFNIGIWLMIAGTIGNFIDRLRLHYVVDMFQLDFINFPIFNIADMCLTFGVIVLFIAIIRDDSE